MSVKKTMNTNKVGRNDICPCGSGKKYKKCCGVNAGAPRKFKATVIKNPMSKSIVPPNGGHSKASGSDETPST